MREAAGLTLVVIADDSDIAASYLERVLEDDPQIRVVGRARNGLELMELPELRMARVVLLDLLMPELGGMSVIRRVGPCPVIAISSEEAGSALAQEALALGALAFFSKRDIAKPAKQQELRDAIKLAGGAAPRNGSRPIGFVVGSTGAIRPLETLVRALRGEPLPLFVVQHLPEGRAESLAELLDHPDYPARVAKHGDLPTPGVIIGADGLHLELDSRDRVRLVKAPPVNGHRPSGDVLLRSAVRLGNRALAVVLSGLGNDGAVALGALADNGGHCFAQHPDDCQASFMPRAAADASARVRLVRTHALGETIKKVLIDG